MQLPFLNKPAPDKNFFLSLLVKPYKIGAILFEEINDKLFILASNETVVESDIDVISSDELLAGADRAISAVEPSLPVGASVEKTIFSLPYDWIIENKIKDLDLNKLKIVCKSLGLTPIGYLTSIEAIIHFIDKSEGAPVSAIFCEITKSRVFVFVVRAGKIIEALSDTISENALLTTEIILGKVHSLDVLPAKIILLDLENSSSVQQEFLSHKWPASIPFLHVPQVVVLEKGFENEAVINGVATQMELEVLTDVNRATSKDNVSAQDDLSGKEQEDVKGDEAVVVRGEDFGFVKDEDIAKSGVTRSTSSGLDVGSKMVEEQNSTEGFESESLKAMGEQALTGQPDVDVNYFKKHEEEIDEEAFPGEKPKFSLPVSFDGIISSIKKIKLPTSLPKLPAGSSGSRNKIIIIAVAAIVLIVAFLFVYYNFILSVSINVFEDTKAVNKSNKITFSTQGGADSIKLATIDEEVKGDEDKSATGKKETGDKAKGTVTIYNKTDSPKTFNKGSTVVGPNSLEFVTTDDIKIASTSAFSTNLSSASVKVEASKFGKEYNIPSGSNFTVKGFSTSDVIAKNSDATSGGSSKTTTVVSDKDISDLLNLLTQKLQGDAVSKAKSETKGNEQILPTALTSEVKDKKFSKKAGDEASSVTLSATIVYTIGKYDKGALDDAVKKLSQSDVPGSYVMEKGDSNIEVKDVEPDKSGEQATATLNVKAVYTPQVDQNSLIKSIKGKAVSDAVDTIKKISGISDVNIQFLRKFPFLPSFLPFNIKNINLDLKH